MFNFRQVQEQVTNISKTIHILSVLFPYFLIFDYRLLVYGENELLRQQQDAKQQHDDCTNNMNSLGIEIQNQKAGNLFCRIL